MGRKAIPDVIKDLEGNRSRDKGLDKRLESSPDVPDRVPDVPLYLRKDQVAAAFWRKYSKILQKSRILTEADLVALEIVSKAYSRWREAEAKIDEAGNTVYMPSKKEGSKYATTIPYVQVANQYYKQFIDVAREFGLTPASRSRAGMAAEVKKPKSKMAQVLKINPRAKSVV